MASYMKTGHYQKMKANIARTSGSDAQILLFGASHFAPNHLKGLPPCFTVAASGGYTATEAVNDFDEVIGLLAQNGKKFGDFKFVIICLGCNDLDHRDKGLAPSSLAAKLDTLRDKVKTESPSTQVVFVSIGI